MACGSMREDQWYELVLLRLGNTVVSAATAINWLISWLSAAAAVVHRRIHCQLGTSEHPSWV